MKQTKIYNLVVVNEDMDIMDVRSFTDEQKARKALDEDYKATKKMLEAEGWDGDSLNVDDLTPGWNYWINYGESSYYAEVKPGILYED